METTEHKGYYSIASGRWVSHAEVVAAETAIEALALEGRALKAREAATEAQKRREEIEARADAAAAAGDFALARTILQER